MFLLPIWAPFVFLLPIWVPPFFSNPGSREDSAGGRAGQGVDRLGAQDARAAPGLQGDGAGALGHVAEPAPLIGEPSEGERPQLATSERASRQGESPP